MPSNNFCAGIHILIKKGSKFLLLKKSAGDKNDPNRWDLPGGGIEFGEQPFETALREAKEEAGIRVKITKILNVWAMPYNKQWSIELLAQGKYLGGKVKLSKEHSGYQWVSQHELKTLKPRSIHLQALINFCTRLEKMEKEVKESSC